MERQVLKVSGMSCNHCKMSIEKALKEIGVDGVVNLNEKTVTVSDDSSKANLNKIKGAIEDQGYDVVG